MIAKSNLVIPFLVVTAALPTTFYLLLLIGNDHYSLGLNPTDFTKSINAEITVRQASRASATNRDPNFVS